MMHPRFDLVSSAYCRQLQQGFRWLRFEPALEAEFRAAHQMENALQLRVVMLLVAIGGIGMAAADYLLFGRGFSNPLVPVRAAITQGLIGLLILTTFPTLRMQALQTPIGLVLGLQIGVVALLANTLLGARAGLEDQVLVYVGATYFIFFCFGLRFWHALPVALCLYFGFLIAAFAKGSSLEQAFIPVWMLGFPNIVGGSTCYALEYSQRKSFLQSRDLRITADHDPLTGLNNRRALSEQLRRLWAHCIREKSSIAVVLFDIDYFKSYNDTYGHPRGDLCLVLIAELLKHTARRPLDACARYGGEEFILLLPGCNARQAATIMHDFRESLATLRIPHKRSAVSDRVTVSIGIADMAPDANSPLPERLITLADEALYEAKGAGRNRIAVKDSAVLDLAGRGSSAVHVENLAVDEARLLA